MEHKTEQGALRLNLADAEAVRDAATALLRLAPTVLVEGMVTDSVAELIVGVRRDPAIGPHLVLGSGGVLVELVADSRILLLPVRAAAVERALDSLKVGRLLAGWRGRPAADRGALVETVLAIAAFAEAHTHTLEELEINPLLARSQGATAVDVLIRCRKLDSQTPDS